MGELRDPIQELPSAAGRALTRFELLRVVRIEGGCVDLLSCRRVCEATRAHWTDARPARRPPGEPTGSCAPVVPREARSCRAASR
jgi:hypothetical protein